MGDTVATTSGGEKPVTRVGFLSSLFPRFDASVSPEFYRLSGKLRALTNLAFLIANFAIAPQTKALGFDETVLWRVLIVFTSIHTVDGLLGVWLWRGHMVARRMRHITYTSLALETAATLFAVWVYGSVNSPFLGVELLLILIYRLAFDFRIGVAAFAAIFLGQWLIFGLELAGVLPPQPIAIVSDGVYAMPARALGAMVNLSFMMTLTFAVASWAIGRIRHKDVALRLLRESLYARDRSMVGRHTGRTLGDSYALGALLGAGGMGEVYVATHLKTQRKVAIKMLHAHLVEDSAVLGRFCREAEVTAKLGSEHIVGVIDVSQDDGQPYIVLELVEGESLAARLNANGPLPFAEVADVIEQMAIGLDLAHRAGIVHRDLKPENVFLCPRRAGGGFTVKLLDFGVSKIRGHATAITNEVAILGTPDYMSPEQALGHADAVEATSDVFALGAVAYKCITGHRPFHTDSVPALLRKICDEEPAPMPQYRPEVPAAVSDVIAVAMAKQPADRYASALELGRDLRAAFEGRLDPAITARAEGLVRGRAVAAKRRKPTTIDVTGETHRG